MRLRLPSDNRWVPRTRRLVTTHARKTGVDESTEQVIALLTTELVTNAVRHGPRGRGIEVSADRAGDTFQVVVSDEGRGRPAVKEPDATATSGRGIGIVDALAADWGVRSRRPTGTSVWFSVPV